MANKDWPIRPPYSDRSPVRYDSLPTNKIDDFRVTATEGARVQHGEHLSNNPPHEKHEKHAILSNSIRFVLMSTFSKSAVREPFTKMIVGSFPLSNKDTTAVEKRNVTLDGGRDVIFSNNTTRTILTKL